MKARAEELIGKISERVSPADSWHEVGSEDEPVFQNSWTATATHFGFRKLPLIGCVHIHGDMTPGTETDGTTIFTLPSGYRPTYETSYSIETNVTGAAGGRLYITATGEVQIYNADTAGTFYRVNIIFPIDI